MWNSPPLMNTSKIHVHVEQFSNWKLTGNSQKDFCTNKAVRKIHTKSDRKERKVIRLGPVLLEGDSEEKGDYMGRDPHWGVSGLRHRLGTPLLGSYTGEMSPLAGQRTTGTNKRAEGSLNFALEECMHAGLSPRQSREVGLKTPLVAAGFPLTTSACAPV